MYTLQQVYKQVASGKVLYRTGGFVQCSVVTWRGGGGGEVPEGRDICIQIAGSLCYTAESNTTLQSNYTPIKKKKRNTSGTPPPK